MYDIIYLKSAQPGLLSYYSPENEVIHNNTMILVDNIHKNRNATVFWKGLIKLKHMTVTIDMFHCGVVFIRKEQVKEHFKIRI